MASVKPKTNCAKINCAIMRLCDICYPFMDFLIDMKGTIWNKTLVWMPVEPRISNIKNLDFQAFYFLNILHILNVFTCFFLICYLLHITLHFSGYTHIYGSPLMPFCLMYFVLCLMTYVLWLMSYDSCKWKKTLKKLVSSLRRVNFYQLKVRKKIVWKALKC